MCVFINYAFSILQTIPKHPWSALYAAIAMSKFGVMQDQPFLNVNLYSFFMLLLVLYVFFLIMSKVIQEFKNYVKPDFRQSQAVTGNEREIRTKIN